MQYLCSTRFGDIFLPSGTTHYTMLPSTGISDTSVSSLVQMDRSRQQRLSIYSTAVFIIWTGDTKGVTGLLYVWCLSRCIVMLSCSRAEVNLSNFVWKSLRTWQWQTYGGEGMHQFENLCHITMTINDCAIDLIIDIINELILADN